MCVPPFGRVRVFPGDGEGFAPHTWPDESGTVRCRFAGCRVPARRRPMELCGRTDVQARHSSRALERSVGSVEGWVHGFLPFLREEARRFRVERSGGAVILLAEPERRTCLPQKEDLRFSAYCEVRQIRRRVRAGQPEEVTDGLQTRGSSPVVGAHP